MIYTTNILAVPMILIIWMIDLYLFVTSIRLVAGRLADARAARLCSCLEPLTDSIPSSIQRWMARRTERLIPPWLPWLAAIVGVMVLRQALVGLVLLISGVRS